MTRVVFGSSVCERVYKVLGVVSWSARVQPVRSTGVGLGLYSSTHSEPVLGAGWTSVRRGEGEEAWAGEGQRSRINKIKSSASGWCMHLV